MAYAPHGTARLNRHSMDATAFTAPDLVLAEARVLDSLPAAELAPLLLAQLGAKEPRIRQWTIDALVAAQLDGKSRDEAIAGITNLADDRDVGVRIATLQALTVFGGTDAITKALRDRNPFVREEAIEAYVRVEPSAEKKLARLRDALDDRVDSMRTVAIGHLG